PANAGLVFIDGGTFASPTTIVGFVLRRDGTTTGSWVLGTKTTWATTTWTSVGAETNGALAYSGNRSTFCLQARYVNSTKVMTVRIGEDCRLFGGTTSSGVTTRTFTNHPGAAGLVIESPASGTARMTVQWIRMRTDSAANAAPFPVGS